MLRIRLRRVGKKKQPSFRIVVADSTSPRDGKFVETIGFYNPRTEPETVRYKEERALYWLSVGTQPSESVRRIFKTYGTWERFERMKAGESIEALVAEAEAGTEAKEVEVAVANEALETETEEATVAETSEEEEVSEEEASEGELEEAPGAESADDEHIEAEDEAETVDDEETEAEDDVEAATKETEA